MHPKVAIIILNWNGWKDTIECLESLYQITYPNYDVIVVDNGSIDSSVNKITKYCIGKIKVKSKFFKYNPNNKPIYILKYTEKELKKCKNIKKEKYFCKLPSNRKLRLILNKKNYGFAKGNNIGITYALRMINPKYLLLLNNDTVVDTNFLTELVKTAETDEKIGIVGPKIYYYNYNGRSDIINYAGEYLNIWKGKTTRIGMNELDTGKYDYIREVDKIDGACMLIKSSVLNLVKEFDPSYFAYWEETDFCIRALKMGFKFIYNYKAKIWHKVSMSSGGNLNSFNIYFLTRNRFIFMKKNAKTLQIMSFLIYFFLKDFAVLTYLLHKDCNVLKAFYKAIYDGLKLLCGL